MNPIAIYSGDTIIYYSAVLICLGAAAWFSLSCGLYTARGGRTAAMWALLPLAAALSVLLSRLIHWYCHAEQYAGLWAALTDYSIGGYCLPGLLLGVVLAVFIVKQLRLTEDMAGLFDALAPGAALGLALIRLSALFNSSCRGTVIVKDPRFQHLPIASAVSTSSGGMEYRFATFFVHFLLLLGIAALLLVFYLRQDERPHGRKGDTALLFLLLYSATELVLDSTRYDSSFLRFNGFVSLVQIVSALSIAGVLAVYSVRSVKELGLRPRHWLLWSGYLLSLIGTGVLEYLVQRYGSWYKLCYSFMSLTCLLMVLVCWGMYLTLKGEKRAYSQRRRN